MQRATGKACAACGNHISENNYAFLEPEARRGRYCAGRAKAKARVSGLAAAVINIAHRKLTLTGRACAMIKVGEAPL